MGGKEKGMKEEYGYSWHLILKVYSLEILKIYLFSMFSIYQKSFSFQILVKKGDLGHTL